MRIVPIVGLGAVLLAFSGCAVIRTPPAAFSEEWAAQRRDDLNHDRRKEKKKEFIFFGEPEGPHTGIHSNDAGRPELFIGSEDGVSADITTDGGDPKIRLKRQWSW